MYHYLSLFLWVFSSPAVVGTDASSTLPTGMKFKTRTILPFFAILVSTGMITPTFAQTVSIPDPGLNAAVRDALQKPSGLLTVSDLLSLTNLNASDRNVSSIDGLEA